MLRILRSGQRWLTAIFIVGVGFVFVLFLGLQGPFSGRGSTTLVRVGSHEFGLREFEQVRARREAAVQAQLGDAYDAKALRDTLDNLAAKDLVDQALLALAAEDLGLTVTKQEVERLVLRDPAFRGEGGSFNREAFRSYAEYEYGSQRAFLEDQRRRLLALKILRVLNEQPAVSEAEAREAVRRKLEKVRIAFVSLDSAARAKDAEITPEAIQEALDTRPDEISALYEELSSRYNRPERVRARHILRRVPADAPKEEVEQARDVLEGARKRIEAGEDFAKLAQELSEDPGSQSRGGELGFFARGQMVPEFENAAFALGPGETSDIVRTDYGFHLIQVEERQEAVNRPLEEVQDEVAEELLRREAGKRAAREVAERLATAVRGGSSLEDAAREAGIKLEHTGWLSRGAKSESFVPGLGASPELLAAAFVMQPGESSAQIFEVGSQLALMQLTDRQEPTDAAIAAGVDDERKELLEARRTRRMNAWIDARRQALVESGQLVVNLESIRN